MAGFVHSNVPPEELVSYFDRYRQFGVKYRRRIVLSRNIAGSLEFVSGVIQAFRNDGHCPPREKTQRYNTALLFEDWLDTADAFARQISDCDNGTLVVDGRGISRTQRQQWFWDIRPGDDIFMRESGLVTYIKVSEGHLSLGQDTLASARAPHYRDITAAARHWLSFPIYNG
jgi:hypothetical protein